MNTSAENKRTKAELLAELQQLRQSERRYRMLVESAQEMIFVVDLQGVVIYVNPYAAQRFGADPQVIVGRKVSDLFPPDIAERQVKNMFDALHSNRSVYIEAPSFLQGEVRWLGTWITPYCEPSGQAIAMMGIARDITERKQIENDLRQAKEYAEKLIQTANVIVVGLDLQGNIQVFNEAAEEITGYHASEVLGKNWFETFVPRERFPEVWEVFTKISSDILVKKFENPILTKAGEEHIISWQNGAIEINGQVTGTLSFGMDVTERRQAERVQAALYQISQAAYAAQSLDELYRLIHEVIMDLMPTRNFYIGLYDPLERMIHFPYFADEKDAEWPPHRLDKSLTSYVIRSGKAALLSSAEIDRLEALGEVAPVGARPVDWLGVPLTVKEQTIGAMVVQSYDSCCRLSEQHKDVLKFISTQVAMVIGRKRAETELEESEERYRTLVEMSPDTIAVHQRGRIVFVNPAAVKLMGAGSIDELIGKPMIEFVHPEYRKLVAERVQGALITGVPLPLIEEKFMRLDGSAVDVEVAATPMIFHGGQAMHVIIRDITPRKEQKESLRRANAELALAYDATLAGWSRALELREQETAGHSQRVVDLTLRLAERLSITGEGLVNIRRGALLHDIGKMGVPDSILLKPGPLTEDEWVIMRQHPVYAYEMLKNIPYLSQALEIPYFHHEHWDGTGYPHGLIGDQIPLGARIFTVVDVYDALTSARPYRPAWPENVVRGYLKSHSGRLFDERVIEEFLALL